MKEAGPFGLFRAHAQSNRAPDAEQALDLAWMVVQKALWAVAHRLVRLIWKILHQKVRYLERGPANLDPIARERRKRNLLRQLKKLRYIATLTPLPAG